MTAPVLPLSRLAEAGACSEQMKIVAAEWPGGIPLTPESASRAAALGLDTGWAAQLLSPAAAAAYDEAIAPAWAAYHEACATAWAAYRGACATAEAAYDEARATALLAGLLAYAGAEVSP